MPVSQQKKINKTTFLAVWKITETADELLIALRNKGFNDEVVETKNEQRLKQWLATRLLVNFFFEDALIVYDELGKPYLDNKWHISISHSNEYVAVILNKNENCGIDIEKISSKVDRIKDKFLNDVDLINVTSEQDLTIYWGAKEALYKYYGKKEVLFIENLFLENFSKFKNEFIGRIDMPNFNKRIPMVWERIDDFMLVYTG